MNPQTGVGESRRIRVRPAQPRDQAFVLGLAARFGATRAAWREHDEVVAGTERQLGNAFDALCDEDALFIAVDANDECIGFAYIVTQTDFFTGKPHAHISEIAAVTDGGGAGSALMEASEAWSRDRGYRYISLNVNDMNDPARRFYERRAYLPEYRHLVKLL